MVVSPVRAASLATLALSALVAACSGLTTGSSGPGGNGASAGPVGQECKSVPTFNLLASPQPSFPVDSTLLEEFPEQVAGQPTGNTQAIPMVAYFCYYLGGQGTVDQMRQTATLGWNIANMSYGSMDATINDEPISVVAVRTPNQDAAQLIQNFGLFAALASISIAGTDLSAATVGGKSVKETPADTDGTRSYFYVKTDTVFVIQDATDAQAAVILQALP